MKNKSEKNITLLYKSRAYWYTISILEKRKNIEKTINDYFNWKKSLKIKNELEKI